MFRTYLAKVAEGAIARRLHWPALPIIRLELSRGAWREVRPFKRPFLRAEENISSEFNFGNNCFDVLHPPLKIIH